MFLGIDIGTSGVKTVLMTGDHQICDSATVALSRSSPKPTWSEQNPDDWWEATNQAVLKLAPDLRAQVQGVGLSGQMHGATLLEDQDRPLRPAILWNDGRCQKEATALQERCPDFLEKAGNLVMPGFTAPKLEWVRRHEPDIFKQTRKVLLPKDYVRLCMSGIYASDMSDSAGTLWLDIEQRDWCDPLLEACGLNRTYMPDLYEGTETTGELLLAIAEAWGMSQIPIYGGGGDNAAGAAAVGVIKTGETLISLGTSGVIFTATDGYRSNPTSAVHSFCHALPNRWHLMSVMLSAASCLDWACKLTGAASVASLVQLAERTKGAQISELFLPYLSGERTPHNNPHAQGVFFGITHETGPGELAQAVLEGVAFGLADGFDALIAAGATMDVLTVIGGGARSSYWGKILANVIDRPLIYRDGGEVGPALGAARLAAYGAMGGVMEDAFLPPAILSEVTPDRSLYDFYADKRNRFTSLYTHLITDFPGDSHA